MSVRGIGPHVSQAVKLAIANVERPTAQSVSSPFPHGIKDAESTVLGLIKNIQAEVHTEAKQKGQEQAKNLNSDTTNSTLTDNNRLQASANKSAHEQQAAAKKSINEAHHETHKPESSRSLAVLARVVEMLKIILNEIARGHSSALEVLAQKVNPPSDASSTDTDTNSDTQEEGDEDSSNSDSSQPVPTKKSVSRPPVLGSIAGYGSKRPFSLDPIEA